MLLEKIKRIEEGPIYIEKALTEKLPAFKNNRSDGSLVKIPSRVIL